MDCGLLGVINEEEANGYQGPPAGDFLPLPGAPAGDSA